MSNNYITADVITNWCAHNYYLGAPVNADEIAPELDRVFTERINADRYQAYADYYLTGDIAFADFMLEYIDEGKMDSVPRPRFTGAEYYLPSENTVPPIGTTLTEDEAWDYMDHIGSVDECTKQMNDTIQYNIDRGYTGDLGFKIAKWDVLCFGRRAEYPYVITRID